MLQTLLRVFSTHSGLFSPAAFSSSAKSPKRTQAPILVVHTRLGFFPLFHQILECKCICTHISPPGITPLTYFPCLRRQRWVAPYNVVSSPLCTVFPSKEIGSVLQRMQTGNTGSSLRSRPQRSNICRPLWRQHHKTRTNSLKS